MLGRKRGTEGKLLLSENRPELHTAWLSKEMFCYQNAVSAAAHYRGETPWPPGNDPGTPATRSANYFDADGKANWNFASLNAADKRLDRNILRKKFTELPQAFRRAKIPFFMSLIDVADFTRGLVSTSVFSEITSNNPLWRSDEILKL